MTDETTTAAQSVELRMLAYLCGRGDTGAMCEQIESYLHVPHRTVSARLAEMVKLGLVYASSRTRRTTRCREAHVMVVTTRGRLELVDRLEALKEHRRFIRRKP